MTLPAQTRQILLKGKENEGNNFYPPPKNMPFKDVVMKTF